MANAGPDTNGSQFFITLAPATYLDGQYSIFGAVIDGLNVLDTLQRVDAREPIALATLDTTLGLLETQGIDFAGADLMTVEAYLKDTLGVLPPDGLRIALGAYDVVLGPDPQTGSKLAAFWPPADYMTNVYILERPK
jgi:hypothetical protein